MGGGFGFEQALGCLPSKEVSVESLKRVVTVALAMADPPVVKVSVVAVPSIGSGVGGSGVTVPPADSMLPTSVLDASLILVASMRVCGTLIRSTSLEQSVI